MKYVVFVIATLLIVSCSKKKEAVQMNVDGNQKVAENTLGAEIDNFKVSFISIGSGIDASAKGEFEAFIEKFQTSNNVIIEYTKYPWGREGEIDYCVRLKLLSSDLGKQFILESKEILKNSKLVRFTENARCLEK